MTETNPRDRLEAGHELIKVTAPGARIMHSKPVKNYILTHEWAQTAGSIAASFFGGPWGAAAWSAYMTEISGGSFSDMLRAGLTSYATAYAFDFVGGQFGGHNAWGVDKIIAHGVVGGVSAELQGGSFREGFFAAGLTQTFSPMIGQWFPGRNMVAARAVAAAVVGGTAAELGGGKFANGAVTGAFSRLFNDESFARGFGFNWIPSTNAEASAMNRLPEHADFISGYGKAWLVVMSTAAGGAAPTTLRATYYYGANRFLMNPMMPEEFITSMFPIGAPAQSWTGAVGLGTGLLLEPHESLR